MLDRGQDRRRRVSSHMTQPQHEQRRGDRRASGTPLTWSEPQPGAIRPGPGEVVKRERRKFPDVG